MSQARGGLGGNPGGSPPTTITLMTKILQKPTFELGRYGVIHKEG